MGYLLTQLTLSLPLQKLSQKINDKVNLQEANLLENGCHHCNMHLEIGHGCVERHRKESYAVFIPKKVLTFCSSPVEKIIMIRIRR